MIMAVQTNNRTYGNKYDTKTSVEHYYPLGRKWYGYVCLMVYTKQCTASKICRLYAESSKLISNTISFFGRFSCNLHAIYRYNLQIQSKDMSVTTLFGVHLQTQRSTDLRFTLEQRFS